MSRRWDIAAVAPRYFTLRRQPVLQAIPLHGVGVRLPFEAA